MTAVLLVSGCKTLDPPKRERSQPPTPPGRMAAPAELTHVEKPPFFKRSRFLKLLGISAACFAVLGMVVNHGGKSKGKPQAAVESAPNIKIPDFGDYRNRANHKAFSPETGVDTRSYPAPPGQSREAAGASTGFL